jgi:hypothetical protein
MINESRPKECQYVDCGWCYHSKAPKPFGCTGIMCCPFQPKAGGSGICEYCGEQHSNVSLHSAHHCRKNPALAEVFKQIDKELERMILGSKKSTEERFIDDILKVYNHYELALSHEDTQGAFKIVKNDVYYQEWLKESLKNATRTQYNQGLKNNG